MTFLAPVAWALAALALPVIAFYLLKTRRRRRQVPTLIFWEQLDPKIENSPLWRKLRRWISLAVQLLILALIIAAIARPAFQWETGAPRRTVAVVDLGPSMMAKAGRTTRWEIAREALHREIDRLRLHDEMAILATGSPPQVLSGWTSSRSELRRAVEGLEPSRVAVEPREALRLAELLAAQGGEPAEILIFSDGVWPGEDASDLMEGMSLEPGPLAVPANVGITQFAVRRLPDAPGEWQLDIEVATSSGQPWEGSLHLTRNGLPLDSVPLELAAGEIWRRSWSGVEPGEIRFAARIDAEDALTADNSAEVALSPLRPVRVRLVGGRDPFLEAAFDSLPLVERVESDAEDIDLVVATSTAEVPTKDGAARLLINPTENGFWGERAGSVQGGPITEVADDEVILRHAGLRQVSFRSATRWEPSPGVRTFASSLDDPVIFGRWGGDERWLAIAFDPANSDLPLRTAFPILLGNIVESLRADHGADAAAAPLPGRIATSLAPIEIDSATGTPDSGRGGLFFPAWMLAVFLGLVLLAVESKLYHRRILD